MDLHTICKVRLFLCFPKTTKDNSSGCSKPSLAVHLPMVFSVPQPCSGRAGLASPCPTDPALHTPSRMETTDTNRKCTLTIVKEQRSIFNSSLASSNDFKLESIASNHQQMLTDPRYITQHGLVHV